MDSRFNDLSEKELYHIDGGLPVVLGVLAAGGIVCGSALVVGVTTYGVKKACEYVGSLF